MQSQDVFAAAILSEVVYKQVDLGNAAAEEAARYLGAMAPLPLTLGSLDWSTSAQSQSYVVGETEDAMVVAFLGTKKKGDLLVSLNLRAAEAFLPLAPDVSVHKGYLSRALSIPTEELYKQATAKGKRLVFAGHSMGGAVATLCALHLLCLLPPHLHRTVSAVGFATPPLGNAALAAAIEARGWGNAVRNFRLQEDWVPDAVALWRSHARMTTTPAPSPSSAFDPGAGDQWVCWGYAPAEAAAA